MAAISRGFAAFLGGLGQGYIQGKANQQQVGLKSREIAVEEQKNKMAAFQQLRMSLAGQLSYLRGQRAEYINSLNMKYGTPAINGQPNPYFIADPALREQRVNNDVSKWDDASGIHTTEAVLSAPDYNTAVSALQAHVVRTGGLPPVYQVGEKPTNVPQLGETSQSVRDANTGVTADRTAERFYNSQNAQPAQQPQDVGSNYFPTSNNQQNPGYDLPDTTDWSANPGNTPGIQNQSPVQTPLQQYQQMRAATFSAPEILPHYATGGPVPAGQPIEVGDGSGPETFVPSPSPTVGQIADNTGMSPEDTQKLLTNSGSLNTQAPTPPPTAPLTLPGAGAGGAPFLTTDDKGNKVVRVPGVGDIAAQSADSVYQRASADPTVSASKEILDHLTRLAHIDPTLIGADAIDKATTAYNTAWNNSLTQSLAAEKLPTDQLNTAMTLFSTEQTGKKTGAEAENVQQKQWLDEVTPILNHMHQTQMEREMSGSSAGVGGGININIFAKGGGGINGSMSQSERQALSQRTSKIPLPDVLALRSLGMGGNQLAAKLSAGLLEGLRADPAAAQGLVPSPDELKGLDIVTKPTGEQSALRRRIMDANDTDALNEFDSVTSLAKDFMKRNSIVPDLLKKAVAGAAGSAAGGSAAGKAGAGGRITPAGLIDQAAAANDKHIIEPTRKFLNDFVGDPAEAAMNWVAGKYLGNDVAGPVGSGQGTTPPNGYPAGYAIPGGAHYAGPYPAAPAAPQGSPIDAFSPVAVGGQPQSPGFFTNLRNWFTAPPGTPYGATPPPGGSPTNPWNINPLTGQRLGK